MGSAVELKQQLAVLEEECNLLRNLALNLSRGDQFGALIKYSQSTLLEGIQRKMK